MASAINRILSSNGSLVQVVTGFDRGESAWHCVLVNKSQFKDFQESMNDNNASVDEYARVLCSGWGDFPPETVLKELQDQYM